MPLSAGSRLGNVVLREPLGKGAMGTVWLAKNEALGSEVAVKVLHAARALDDDARTRFEREAKGLAQLDSPHVVRVFDYGITDDGEPYIVMERLVGRDLKSYIQQMGPLPRELTLTIMRQLCRALRYAHERGVLHRDIKPANVFLVEADGEPFVKVLDFGIAKYHAADMDLTETGQLMGTPYYMSPEQFMSPRDIDHRSDLWSAAVVAYACMVGKLPFLGDAVGAITIAAYTGDYKPPSEVRPTLPTSIDDWTKTAFAAEPSGRFPDADTLFRSLEASYPREAVTEAEPASAEELVPTEQDEATQEKTNDDAPTVAREASALANQEHTLLEATAPMTARKPEAPPTKRWVGPAIAAVVVISGVGLWMASRSEEAPASASTASADVSASLPESSAPEEAPEASAASDRGEAVIARLGVAPPNAVVRVNGSLRPVAGGEVELEGLPGDSFVVELSLDGRSMQHTVVMKRDGETSPASIELAAPARPGPRPVPKTTAPPPPPPAVKPREGWP